MYSFTGNKKCFERTKQDLLFEVVRGTRHLFSINLSGCQLPEVMDCLSEAAMSVLDPVSLSYNYCLSKAAMIVLDPVSFSYNYCLSKAAMIVLDPVSFCY